MILSKIPQRLTNKDADGHWGSGQAKAFLRAILGCHGYYP